MKINDVEMDLALSPLIDLKLAILRREEEIFLNKHILRDIDEEDDEYRERIKQVLKHEQH